MSTRGYFEVLLLSNMMACWAGVLVGSAYARRQVLRLYNAATDGEDLVRRLVKFLTGKDLPQ